MESPDTSRPDYRIGVVKDTQTGKNVAVAKACPEWHQYVFDGLENHFRPQFGCFDSYNLAHEVVQPNDLVAGRKPGEAEAAPGVLSIERYREDKTKKLMNPKESEGGTTKD